jgi:hypothetical protein
MIAEAVIICALWGGAVLVAVDGAWVGSYIAANNDRPEGMPSYFASEEEKEMYSQKMRGQAARPSEYEYDNGSVSESSAYYDRGDHYMPPQRLGGDEGGPAIVA